MKLFIRKLLLERKVCKKYTEEMICILKKAYGINKGYQIYHTRKEMVANSFVKTGNLSNKFVREKILCYNVIKRSKAQFGDL